MLSNEVLAKLLCRPNLQQQLFFQSRQTSSFYASHCTSTYTPNNLITGVPSSMYKIITQFMVQDPILNKVEDVDNQGIT